MKFRIKITSVKPIDELEGFWTSADFTELLKRFEYPDAEIIKESELKEYLFMAIADFEPNEAAAILLDYKLSDVLAEGQIDNISHEMTREKVAENYSEIDLHKPLFAINQLLYKAYNGKFPNTTAQLVDFEIKPVEDEETEITKELVLKAVSEGLSENSLLKRLLSDQLEGKVAFPEAEGIVWELKNKGSNQYTMITSGKWLKEKDFTMQEFESEANPYEENGEE